MSYYTRGYRSYGYRGRTGYRRGYNRYWRRNWGRQRSLYRSQVAGNRRFNLVVPTSDVFTMVTPEGSYWTPVKCVQPYVQNAGGGIACGSMVFSPLYRTYSQLYDQVKINSVQVKLSILNVIGNGGLVPALKVFTMWDRDIQYQELSSAHVPSVLALQNGAESQCSLIVNNSRSVLYRNNRASDIQERTIFHDCGVSRNSDNGYFDVCFAGGNGVTHGMGYVPGMYFSIQTNSSPGEGTNYTFNISLEIKWNVTFRNPKYGLTSSSNSKMEDMKKDVIDEIKEGDDLLDDGEKKDEGESAEMTDEEVTALLEKLKKVKLSDDAKKDES